MDSITLTKRALERFSTSFDKESENGCWEWTRTRNEKGYGVLRIGKRHLRAHRLSWMLYVGEIADGLEVLHKCDNRCCVNPGHLFLGTQLDNMRDMVSKGRNIFGEKHKLAKLSESNVIEILQLLKTKSAQEISKMFGVSRRLISAIGQGKKWKHVERK